MAYNAIHHLALKRLGAWKRRRPVKQSQALAWEPIRFPTAEGSQLAGLYGRAGRAAKGTVVLVPPAREAKEFFLRYDYARILREAGYHVLLFDFNGTGESEQWGFYLSRDVLAAGEEARRRAPGGPVGLLGVCFGAVYGIRALTQGPHPFTSMLAEAPYTEASAFLANMEDLVGWPTRFQRALIDLLLPYFPGTRVVDEVHRVRDVRQMLFVYGDADPLAPPQMGRAFVAALRREQQRDAGAPACALREVPAAGHLGLFEDAPQHYRQQITDFFDRTLAGGPAAGPARADAPAPRLRREAAIAGAARRTA